MSNTTISEKIDRWLSVHRDELIRDIQGLVQIPSVSVPDEQCPPYGQACRDALGYMYRLAEKHGYPTRDFDHYVGTVDFTSGDASIGIWSHLDVVPVPNPDEWAFPPFSCTLVEDRYLIGRGVQDNKMTAVAFLHVMNCLRDLGVPLRHGYSLYMGTSEETGMEDCRYFVARYPCPDLSLVPDTGFPICIGQRGCLRFQLSVPFDHNITVHEYNNPSVTPEEIEVILDDGSVIFAKGVSTPASVADRSGNAIFDLLARLSDHYPDERGKLKTLIDLTEDPNGLPLGIKYADPQSGPLRLAPTFVQAGDGKLALQVYSILPITADSDALLDAAAAKAKAVGATLELISLRKGCRMSEDHPVVTALTDTYRTVTGYDAAPFVMTGGNYAAILPNAFGFGPGMPGRKFPGHIFKPGHGDFHQCDESEDVEHILAFMRVYAMSILRLEEMDSSRLKPSAF